MLKYFVLLLFLFTSLFADSMYKRPAFILAAGNLKFVFPKMIKEFYKKHPDASVHIQYGASGTLANSILKGKKYDIFFSADISYSKKIYDAKKSATKPKNYAQGLLILFIPSSISSTEKGLKILDNKKIKYITVANRVNAPYGASAMEAIKNSKCSKIKDKIRYSSDVITAIDNIIWNGHAGILSKSALYMIPDNRKKEGVDWVEIDSKLYTPIIQSYVVSKKGLKNDNAQKFLYFIESEEGQKLFRVNGYKNINEVTAK